MTEAFLKINLSDPINLEFVRTKNVIGRFKYINISNIYNTVDSFYLKLTRSDMWKKDFRKIDKIK